MNDHRAEPPPACPGYCCSDISIRYGDGYLTTEQLAEFARDPAEKLARFYRDRMLIPLGKGVDGVDHFDCNFFDEQTRLCTNYAERPTMCRIFPVAQGCQICTYDSRMPDVPGVLREEFSDPEALRAFVAARRRRAYGDDDARSRAGRPPD